MADIDEPVELVSWDPRWADWYAQESRRLRDTLGREVVATEHFGSTSVTDLAAKPIVDILVGIVSWPPSSELRLHLVALGYEDMGEAGVSGRIYFRRRSAESFNLAVTAHEGTRWRDSLATRDLLRANPALAKEYEAVKRSAVERGATTLIAYNGEKSSFVAGLVAKATGL
jgi:GrpB-like predicted nucleotidyltransferase (UPF0157 family)